MVIKKRYFVQENHLALRHMIAIVSEGLLVNTTVTINITTVAINIAATIIAKAINTTIISKLIVKN